MGIHKYKTFEEAERALWNVKIDSEYINKIKELYLLKEKLSPYKVKRGIVKLRTFKEAGDHKRFNYPAQRT